MFNAERANVHDDERSYRPFVVIEIVYDKFCADRRFSLDTLRSGYLVVLLW